MGALKLVVCRTKFLPKAFPACPQYITFCGFMSSKKKIVLALPKILLEKQNLRRNDRLLTQSVIIVLTFYLYMLYLIRLGSKR